MKLTGIVRRIDELGRIVLPREIRTTLNINDQDPLEILVDDNGQVILRKYEPACVFCNSHNGVITFKGHKICSECRKQITDRFERGNIY